MTVSQAAQDAGDPWFRALIEAAPEVYFRYAFVPSPRFVYVSPAVQAVTGFAAEEFCRDPAFCVRLVPRDDRRVLRQIVRARRGLTIALRLTRQDGAIVSLAVRTVPLIRRGRLVAVEGVASAVPEAHAIDVGAARRTVAAHAIDVGSAFRRTVTAATAAEPVQQRLAALLYEVHDLLHRTLVPPAAVQLTQAFPNGAIFRCKEVVLNAERLTVSLDGVAVALTVRELMLLRYLFQHAGRVITRQQLLTDVWDYRYTGDDRTVDVHISRLRRKLPPLGRCLVALKNIGYRFDLPEVDAPTRSQIASF